MRAVCSLSPETCTAIVKQHILSLDDEVWSSHDEEGMVASYPGFFGRCSR